ncbi:MAG: tRNA-specific adenosine deaminase [Cyclobacteriaceae bacterium]|nr:MAG: tRNA-specific adenosine deaminase [Cyclobacteriaceae bacterium]
MDFSVFSDEHYMKLAYQEAQKAKEQGEIPVGAIIVCGQTIVAKAHNQTEILQDVTAHAEILAITAAANNLGAKYLTECSLFVTLEPCAMCAGAIFWSQLQRLVYGAADLSKGYTNYSKSKSKSKSDRKSKSNSNSKDLDKERSPGGQETGTIGLLHPRTEVVRGLMAEPCGRLVEDFFRELRN